MNGKRRSLALALFGILFSPSLCFLRPCAPPSAPRSSASRTSEERLAKQCKSLTPTTYSSTWRSSSTTRPGRSSRPSTTRSSANQQLSRSPSTTSTSPESRSSRRARAITNARCQLPDVLLCTKNFDHLVTQLDVCSGSAPSDSTRHRIKTYATELINRRVSPQRRQGVGHPPRGRHRRARRLPSRNAAQALEHDRQHSEDPKASTSRPQQAAAEARLNGGQQAAARRPHRRSNAAPRYDTSGPGHP